MSEKIIDTISGKLEHQIVNIRGNNVMLDRDLAKLYEVEVRTLNQAVKRNKERFPEDFMFQLSKEELQDLKSHFVISSWGGDRRACPYVLQSKALPCFLVFFAVSMQF